MSEPALRIILDTSAVLAYARASVHVGETIAEVVDEGARFGVPVVCLAEAVRGLGRNGWVVELLVAHPACTVLSARAADWRALAQAASIAGRVDLGSAIIAAVDLGAYVLTGEPASYRGFGDRFGDSGAVIPI